MWCDKCRTILANEQVVTDAAGAIRQSVTKKDLEQWYIKITDYATACSMTSTK